MIEQLEDMKRRLSDTSGIANAIADQVLLGPRGVLARNYDASGLKRRSNRLFAGIAQRGAYGNYVRVTENSLTVGIAYQPLFYAKDALEGRGPRYAKRARFLRLEIDGKVFFRKSVGPAPAHRVYYIESGDMEKAQEVITAMVQS